MKEKKDIDLNLNDKTAALLMLDKKERRLIKELIRITLKSPNARELISKRLGSEYLEIGENLLKIMGGR